MSETSASSSSASTPAKTSPAFTLVVLGLMLLIIATLAMLWSRERSARVSAQRDYAALAQEYQKLQQTVGSFLGGGMAMPGGGQKDYSIAREDLIPQSMVIDGKPRQAYLISPKAGAKIGFEPGDIIVVAPAPQTQP